eukprot:m51a1_g1202 hypothetical protein (366) ;mRNA; f:455469-456732
MSNANDHADDTRASPAPAAAPAPASSPPPASSASATPSSSRLERVARDLERVESEQRAIDSSRDLNDFERRLRERLESVVRAREARSRRREWLSREAARLRELRGAIERGDSVPEDTSEQQQRAQQQDDESESSDAAIAMAAEMLSVDEEGKWATPGGPAHRPKPQTALKHREAVAEAALFAAPHGAAITRQDSSGGSEFSAPTQPDSQHTQAEPWQEAGSSSAGGSAQASLSMSLSLACEDAAAKRRLTGALDESPIKRQRKRTVGEGLSALEEFRARRAANAARCQTGGRFSTPSPMPSPFAFAPPAPPPSPATFELDDMQSPRLLARPRSARQVAALKLDPATIAQHVSAAAKSAAAKEEDA